MKKIIITTITIISVISCTKTRNIAYDNGLKLIEQHDYKNALKTLHLANKFDSTNIEVYFLLGKSHFMLQNYDSAIFYFEKANIMGKKDSQLFYMLGVSKYEINDFECSDFLIALTYDENFQEAWYYAGLCLIEIGDYDGAHDYLTKSIALNPQHYQSYQQRSLASYASYNYYLALQDIDSAILIHDSSKYIYQKAVILDRMDAFKEALESCNEVLKSDSLDIKTLRLKAQTLINLNRKKEGCDVIKKVVRIDSTQDISMYKEICF